MLEASLSDLVRELITAAIAGFEEQKKRLNAQIAELRQMLSGSVSSNCADSSPPTARRRQALPRPSTERPGARQRSARGLNLCETCFGKMDNG